jgi:hypothetical protein
MRPLARRLEPPHERDLLATAWLPKKPGERTGSRPQPPEAGARRASLDPGRAPGYRELHSCFPLAGDYPGL